MSPPIVVTSSASELDDKLKEVIEAAFKECDSEFFTVGLSGGSFVKVLSNVLPKLHLTGEEWRKWIFFFVDERVVGFDDSESTFGQYKTVLLPKVAELSLNQFVVINPNLDAEACAFDYLSKMKRSFRLPVNENGFPVLDLVLLGMGPDGHTASLFPGHALLDEKQKWVAHITDSPKPPPSRVTFTLPLINAAKRVAFVATGASKAPVLKEIFVDKKPLPASLVQPSNGHLYWLVDKEAAADLPSSLIS